MEQINKRLMNWASILEPKTRAQAEMTSGMPFIYPHLALMPDAHLGKGATVGSVIPTLGAVMPAAVGVDIGCGMMAVRTQFHVDDLPPRKYYSALREEIEKVIPLSAGGYNKDFYDEQTEQRVKQLDKKMIEAEFEAARYAGNWELQLGSLGSGNHFIEVTLDELQRVWLFLHSGSRGVGNKIAQHHIKVAQRLCEQWWIQLPDQDLAYLVEGTDEFWAYIREMRWAQTFAYLNREEMMHRLIEAFEHWVDHEPVEQQQVINCFPGSTEVSAVGVKRSYKRWYDGKVTRVQTRSGRTVIVTPNHPLLTERGWVASGKIESGDKLVGRPLMHVASVAYPEVESSPTTFEKVHTSLVERCGSSRIAPTSAQFHGDLSTLDGEVDVVWANGELRLGQDSTLVEELSKLDLTNSDLDSGHVLPDGFTVRFQITDDATSTGVLSGSSKIGTAVGSDATHSCALRLATGAQVYPGGDQLVTNRSLTGAEDTRDVGLRDAGLIELDEVVSVDTDSFSGYVYNLETKSGFYLANGIIAHNCHHNYTEQETHFGKKVWLSRKGAIDASEDTWGLIPGSMGTASYVVQGKGNALSLNSSPHGAGRNYSRSAARKAFTIEDLRSSMGDIEYRDTDAFVDEIPAAYKDIDVVMKDADDLVTVRHTLRQIINVKGE